MGAALPDDGANNAAAELRTCFCKRLLSARKKQMYNYGINAACTYLYLAGSTCTMADVWPRTRRPASKIQIAIEQLETFTKRYDACVTATILVCLAMLVSLFFSAHLVSHSKLSFHNNWVMSSRNAHENMTSYPKRMCKRAMSILESNCEGQSATFAPQILVNGKPWNVLHVFLCDLKIHMTNPKAVVIGSDTVTCEEEHQGTYKLKHRHYPLTVETEGGKQFTVVSAADACSIWNALDLIHGIW